jgi:hypothetical protein
MTAGGRGAVGVGVWCFVSASLTFRDVIRFIGLCRIICYRVSLSIVLLSQIGHIVIVNGGIVGINFNLS